MTSPKATIQRKISKNRPFRVLVLGQPAVGKSALTVRFLTRRFIGEYDPTLEKKYSHQTVLDEDPVFFEVLDSAGQMGEESLTLEENIRWADGFILMYSITDRCSFDECTRLKFLINHAKKGRKSSVGGFSPSHNIPVSLVGNQNDLEHDRMVLVEDGLKRAEDLGCTEFHDISVRESYEDVQQVFTGLCRQWFKTQKVRRTSFRELTRVSPPSPRKRANALALLSEEPGNKEDRDSAADLGERKTSISKRIVRKVLHSMGSRSRETEASFSGSDST